MTREQSGRIEAHQSRPINVSGVRFVRCVAAVTRCDALAREGERASRRIAVAAFSLIDDDERVRALP